MLRSFQWILNYATFFNTPPPLLPPIKKKDTPPPLFRNQDWLMISACISCCRNIFLIRVVSHESIKNISVDGQSSIFIAFFKMSKPTHFFLYHEIMSQGIFSHTEGKALRCVLKILIIKINWKDTGNSNKPYMWHCCDNTQMLKLKIFFNFIHKIHSWFKSISVKFIVCFCFPTIIMVWSGRICKSL